MYLGTGKSAIVENGREIMFGVQGSKTCVERKRGVAG